MQREGEREEEQEGRTFNIFILPYITEVNSNSLVQTIDTKLHNQPLIPQTL